jgi:hypothetical protein
MVNVEILFFLQDLWNWEYFPQAAKCQGYQSLGFQIKGILL